MGRDKMGNIRQTGYCKMGIEDRRLNGWLELDLDMVQW